MSGYNSFAVVGAGSLGSHILNALAATENVSVVLLSRPGSSKTPPSGVRIVQVEYSDAAAVAAVFNQYKVDVVISTIGTPAVGVQKSLADGAKIAGVKLFLPSEFGIPTGGHTGGVFDVKNGITAHLKSLGIPTTIIHTGYFTEYIPLIAGYANGKFTIVGKGDAPISFTSLADISGFVAYALTTLPPSELADRTLRLQGDRASWNEVAALFNASVEHVDALTGPMAELRTGLARLVDAGAGSSGWDQGNKKEGSGSDAAGSANALWPGHHWRSIKEVHNL
ncbi:NAD(P)-binding protein [Mycena galopus ATCC 62051]|nr:NAD(P)-binding protein [Mycena galopus ATCC 62051]